MKITTPENTKKVIWLLALALIATSIIVEYYSASGTITRTVAASCGAHTVVTKDMNIPTTTASLGINSLVNNLTAGIARAISVSTLSLEQN